MAERYDEELLLGYVEGDLDAASRAQVEQWVREDPRLARLLASLSSDRDALRQMPDPAAPDWLMDEVDRQLERSMLVDEPRSASTAATLRQRHVLRRIMVVGSVAAMFAVVGAVVISSLQPASKLISEVAMRDEPPPAPEAPLARKLELGKEELGISPAAANKSAGLADPSASSYQFGGNVPAQTPAAPMPATPPSLASVVDAPVAPSLTQPETRSAVTAAAAPRPDGGNRPVAMRGLAAEPAPAPAPAPAAGKPADATDKRDLLRPAAKTMEAGRTLTDVAAIANLPLTALGDAQDEAQMLAAIAQRPELAQHVELVITTVDRQKTTQQIERLDRKNVAAVIAPDVSAIVAAESAAKAKAIAGDGLELLKKPAEEQTAAKDRQTAIGEKDRAENEPLAARVLKESATADFYFYRPGGAQDHAARYDIEVAADQLPQLLTALKQEKSNTRVRLVPRGSSAASAGNRRQAGAFGWPAMNPDFSGILKEQLAQIDAAGAAPTPASPGSLIALPVVLESAPTATTGEPARADSDALTPVPAASPAATPAPAQPDK